jgi:hypothetical protein
MIDEFGSFAKNPIGAAARWGSTLGFLRLCSELCSEFIPYFIPNHNICMATHKNSHLLRSFLQYFFGNFASHI